MKSFTVYLLLLLAQVAIALPSHKPSIAERFLQRARAHGEERRVGSSSSVPAALDSSSTSTSTSGVTSTRVASAYTSGPPSHSPPLPPDSRPSLPFRPPPPPPLTGAKSSPTSSRKYDAKSGDSSAGGSLGHSREGPDHTFTDAELQDLSQHRLRIIMEVVKQYTDMGLQGAAQYEAGFNAATFSLRDLQSQVLKMLGPLSEREKLSVYKGFYDSSDRVTQGVINMQQGLKEMPESAKKVGFQKQCAAVVKRNKDIWLQALDSPVSGPTIKQFAKWRVINKVKI